MTVSTNGGRKHPSTSALTDKSCPVRQKGPSRGRHKGLCGRGAPSRGQIQTKHKGHQSKEPQILDVQIQIKSWFRVFVLSLGCSVGRQQDSVSTVRTTDCLQQQMRARRSLRSMKLRLIIQTLSGLGGHSCFQKQPPSANILKIKIYIYIYM